jgi:hypothetical protein
VPHRCFTKGQHLGVSLADLEEEKNRELIMVKAAMDHWWNATGELLVARGVSGINQIKIGAVLWMHISTGQLCIEVNDNQVQDPTRLPWIVPSSQITPRAHSFGNKSEADILAHMPLDDIHRIFSSSAKSTWSQIISPGSISLGSLTWPIPGYEHPFKPYSKFSLFDLGPTDVVTHGWMASDALGVPSTLSKKLVTLPNGRTR